MNKNELELVKELIQARENLQQVYDKMDELKRAMDDADEESIRMDIKYGAKKPIEKWGKIETDKVRDILGIAPSRKNINLAADWNDQFEEHEPEAVEDTGNESTD